MASASNKKKNQQNKEMVDMAAQKDEAILWVALAFCAILLLSNFGLGGSVGRLLRSIFFGIFGIVAYIFPICMVVMTAFLISNKDNRVAWVKLAASAAFLLFLCFFVELATGHAESALEAFSYGREKRAGGGFLGGLFASVLRPAFGTVGAYVVDIAGLIIMLVLITEKSFLRGMQRGGQKVYHVAREETVRRKEQREANVQKRRDRVAIGVSLDTTVGTAPHKEMELAPPKKESKKKKEKEKEKAKGANAALPEAVGGLAADAMDAINRDAIQSDAINREAIDRDEINIDDVLQTPPVSEKEHVLLRAERNPGEELRPIPESEGAKTTATTYHGQAIPGIQGLHEIQINDDAWDGQEEPALAETIPKAASSPQATAGENYIDIGERGAAKEWREAESQAEGDHEGELGGIDQEILPKKEESMKYIFPPAELLNQGPSRSMGDTKAHLQETANKLQQTLKNFGVNVTITNVSCGPTVTRYELQPEMGVKVSKIVNLADDIKLNLAAADIRIEAPIPGKAAIGIEVPNKETVMVAFRDLIESEAFQGHASSIAFAVGKDITGNVIVADIAKMPHLLIAGATGSGKSVCINTIIMSILFKADPEDVKLIMIDPKVVELSVYNGIPHLFIPVVTDPKKASGALHWAVSEMTDRYQKFADYNVRDLKGYNKKVEGIQDIEDENKPQKLPQIVIIVDELADLMMVAPGEVEDAICRLAQLARAAGIHLIIATQRPSVNVITGLIKANMPSRIAFAVTSGVDSRTILDMNGAEKLLGKGDMLFYPQGYSKPLRVQGAFVSDQEVHDVVQFLTQQNGKASYDEQLEEQIHSASLSGAGDGASLDGNERDAYFADAAKLLMEKEKGSIGMLQRYFKIGFNRAARIMDQLEEAGVVGPEEGTKPRKILMGPEEFEQYQEEYL